MKTLSVIAACAALCAGHASAQNQPSDLFRITLPGAAPITVTIPEFPVAAPESSAIFNLPVGPDGLFAGVLPTSFGPIVGAVALLEPAGTVPDPGETPVFWGNRILSDLVISFATPNSLVAPVGVIFISDGNSNLAPWAALLLASPTAAPAITETGAFQDVTAFLSTPYKVEVASDVEAVPEIGTAALMLAGLGAITWATRRRFVA